MFTELIGHHSALFMVEKFFCKEQSIIYIWYINNLGVLVLYYGSSYSIIAFCKTIIKVF